jgi:RES domain-containing protein
MLKVWRLAHRDYGTDLSGKGNARTGARWNSPGRGVVYASFNLSLCVLETYVHLPPTFRTNLPEMTAVKIGIPGEASELKVNLADLPANLDDRETDDVCCALGDRWLTAQEHLICTVPSIVVPQERNILINPAHRLMSEVRIISAQRFRFDPRLAAPPA